jgi:hypothetical protein
MAHKTKESATTTTKRKYLQPSHTMLSDKSVSTLLLKAQNTTRQYQGWTLKEKVQNLY